MKHRIITSLERPPVPVDPFWTAHSDNLGADDSPYGKGATEAEAIADLECQLEDMAAPDEDAASLETMVPFFKWLNQ